MSILHQIGGARDAWGNPIKGAREHPVEPSVTATPVKLTKRSEADKDAYLSGKHIEALSEIARLKAEVGRLTLENATLRAANMSANAPANKANAANTDRKAYQRELMRKRRAAAKCA